ncbi:hypothetical protein J5N97_023241 [Dioscorea zingiberensis]|uniref:Uncharacterized protein n=1 Tax=Dioscorea zingiberensis TaxID=325984 RepID=A0A9D5CCC5_9LILI|nr:hypothetical protein J5N97_023241 [Dioscorea zingiberensis]
MLVNTVKEFETTGLSMLHKLFGLPVLPLGPLLCKPLSSSLDDASRCVDWLDSHRPGTVLYVSFGSQNSINASQMTELAAGLEESGKPFIWVIRPPFGFVDFVGGGELKPEWLPEGFGERMKEKKQGLEEMMSAYKVERERVKKVVDMVMGGTEKGVEMKKKAMEISEMIRASMEVNNGVMGSSIQSLEEFFTAFLS